MSSLFFAAVSTAGAVIGVAGVVLLLLGFVRASKARASANWPRVKGTVTRSEVVENDNKEESEPARTWKPLVEYRYEVNGVAYTSARISFDDVETGDPKGASDIVREFPTGASIDVHYRPEAHSESVLKPGLSWASGILPVLGVGLVILGVAMVGISMLVARHFQAT